MTLDVYNLNRSRLSRFKRHFNQVGVKNKRGIARARILSFISLILVLLITLYVIISRPLISSGTIRVEMSESILEIEEMSRQAFDVRHILRLPLCPLR